MSLLPTEQSTSIESLTQDNSFSEEAIDLLLLLEQELPKYIKDSNTDTLKIIIDTIVSLKIGAEKLNLNSIVRVADFFENICNNCRNKKIIIDNNIAIYLNEALESLQVLLMGSFMGSSMEEQKIINQIQEVFIDFERYIKNIKHPESNENLLEEIKINFESNPTCHTESIETDKNRAEEIILEDREVISEEIKINSESDPTCHTESIETDKNRAEEIILEDREVISEEIKINSESNPTCHTESIEMDENRAEEIILEDNKPEITSPRIIKSSFFDNPKGNLDQNKVDFLDNQVNASNVIKSPVYSELSQVITETAISENADFKQVKERDLLVKQIFNTVQDNDVSKLEYSSLVKLSNFINTLKDNNNLQLEIDESNRQNIQQLSKQLKKIHPLVDEVKTWSTHLNDNNRNSENSTSDYSSLLNNSVELISKEISDLTATINNLKVNEQKSERQLHQQKKLFNSSYEILNNISFQDILQPLENVWSQLQTLHDKSVDLNIINPYLKVERKLGKKIYALLLYFCWYLLEETVENEVAKYNFDKDTTTKITIDNYRQNNNLIINISNDSQGEISYPYFSEDNNTNVSFDSELFSNSELSLSNTDLIAVKEIRQQLNNLHLTLNITSNPQKGTKITVKIPLDQVREQLVFFKVKSYICAFLLNSIKQIILPQNAKITHTEFGKRLVLRNTTQTIIPIINLNHLLSTSNYLLNKFKTVERENQNIDRLEHSYIVIGNHRHKYAVKINRFLGKDTSLVSSLETSDELPNYIVGSSIYEKNRLVLVLDGLLLSSKVSR